MELGSHLSHSVFYSCFFPSQPSAYTSSFVSEGQFDFRFCQAKSSHLKFMEKKVRDLVLLRQKYRPVCIELVLGLKGEHDEKKILIVLTSHNQLGDNGESTGFWLEELPAPYYRFPEADFDVTIASPNGGQPPTNPKSNRTELQTDETRRFVEDKTANRLLAETLALSEVDPADFDAIFYSGGHGPLWDLVSDEDSIRLIEAFWKQN